jgi:hypothetical protein
MNDRLCVVGMPRNFATEFKMCNFATEFKNV